MARTWIEATELVVAANHPYYPDSKNRVGKEIWTAFTAEHYADGTHKPGFTGFPIPATGTYAGTGAAQTIAFTITSFTEILLLMIFSEEDGNVYAMTGDMTPSMKSSAEEAAQTDRVTSLTTSGFTLGTAAETNTNAIDYYYFVIGIGTTPDAGTNATPPTWIQHDAALLGGSSATTANSVESALDTVFQVEHSETGAHDDIFSGFPLAEQGSFTPTGSVSQLVELDNTEMTVEHVFLLPPLNNLAYMNLAMPKLREFATAALSANGHVLPTTGGFFINSTIIGDYADFLEILSDTTDGSTTFADSSAYVWPISLQSGTGVTHSTTQHHTGASSVKFLNNKALIASMSLLKDDAMFSALPGKSIFTLSQDFKISCERWEDTRAVSSPNTFGYVLRSFFHPYLSVSSNNVRWGSPSSQNPEIIYWGYRIWTVTLSVNFSGNNTTAGIRIGLRTNYMDNPALNTYYDDITIAGTTVINDGAWHNLAIVCDAGLISLEVDSVVEGTPIMAPWIAGQTYYDGVTEILMLDYVNILGGQAVSTTPTYLDDITLESKVPYFGGQDTCHYVAIGSQA